MTNTNIQPKKRRGLSSLVGALIFVVLMVATFSVLGSALTSQTNIVETNMAVANTELEKQQERFTINVSADGSQTLKVDVNNLGQNPVDIRNLIITNYTGTAAAASGYPTKMHDIASDSSFIASGDTQDIVDTTPLVLDLAAPTLTEIYHFKVISSLGTIKTASMSCDDTACGAIASGGGGLQTTFFLDGPNGVNTQISTAIMFVSNTYDVAITDVQPTAGWSVPFCDDLWTVDDTGATETKFVEDIDPCAVTPSAAINLDPHESTLFKWDGTVAGDIGSVFTFCSGVQGTHPADGPVSSVPSCDTLTVIDPNDCGLCGPGGQTIILIDDLLIRPEMFMIIPSPFGDTANNDNYKGVWGVNVVNPTEKPMDITKLTIVAYPPGANNNDIVIDNTSCIISGIIPASDWSCPRINTLLWQNIGSPITIPAYSNQSFLAKVEPGSISANADIDALIVQANAFTTTGAFGKSSYQSTMFDPNESIVNVYLTSTDQSRTDIQSDRLGLTELTNESFLVTVADMDDDVSTYVQAGAKLVINVPREWTNVAITSETNFNGDTDPGPADSRIVVHSDGSTQISAITSANLGQNIEAFTLGFDATPPSNEGVPEKLYIMYVLADGITVGGNPIGPLNEIVLQVVP